MDNVQEFKDRVRLYLVDQDPGDESDVRDRLVGLQRGERLVNGKVMYSAAWIDDEGNLHEFSS
jgi:hypothetical protein